MKRTGGQRGSSWRTSLGRIAGVALAVGGLSALALAPSIAAAATSPTTASVVSTATTPKHGTILVSGTTVYALKPSKKACTAACLKVWPPVLLPQGVTSPTAGPGVDASKLGTTPAAGGALQITYAGKPLYWFAKDKAPGQVKGNVTDKWGKWYTMVTAKASSASTPKTPGSTPKTPSTSKPNAGTGGAAF